MPLYEFECSSCQKRTTELMPAGSSEANCPLCFAPMKKLVSGFAWGLHVHFTDEAQEVNTRQKLWVETPEIQAKLKSGELYIDDRPDNGRSDRPEKSAMDMIREAEALRCLDDVSSGACESPDEFFSKVEKAKTLPQFCSTGPLSGV